MNTKVKNRKGLFCSIIVLSLIMASCVSPRKFSDTQKAFSSCIEENEMLRNEQARLQDQILSCEEQLLRKTRDVENLSRDTARLASTLELEFLKNSQLNQTYELLLQKNKELLADNRFQTEKISTELAMTQEQLIRKEDELKKLESDLTLLQAELKKKESSLNDLEKNLNQSKQEMERSRKELEQSQQSLAVSQSELEEKQQKLFELQRILTEKDSMVTALRNTVSEALLGFSDKGLKVEERNGKVYVSMDNKLLFASGSTAVGAEGSNALVELGKVLEANPEINVMVEGHTDDVPLRGSGQMKDNWDLSVLRATEIVRIILSNDKIDPSRITAAGRSQYLPVDPKTTAEARAKNRRTEIILTPKLDELFRVIDSN